MPEPADGRHEWMRQPVSTRNDRTAAPRGRARAIDAGGRPIGTGRQVRNRHATCLPSAGGYCVFLLFSAFLMSVSVSLIEKITMSSSQ